MSRPARRCSRRFALAALAAAGCAPRVAYRAEAADTRALCGFDHHDEGALRAAAATLPSRECADAIFDDYNVDVDAFLAADGLDDPYFLVEVTADTLPRAQRRSRLALVLLNARGLLSLITLPLRPFYGLFQFRGTGPIDKTVWENVHFTSPPAEQNDILLAPPPKARIVDE